MSRKRKPVVFCLLLVALAGCSRDDGRAYATPGGEFSYVPPDNWTLREMPGAKYKLAFGRPSGDFAPNINVVDEYAPVSLDDYVAETLRVMPEMSQRLGINDLRVLSQSRFTTDSGQGGFRVVTESEMNGRRARQTYYFFDGGGGRKFVVTCSVLAAGGESYDQLFDASMKTFKTGRA